MATSDIPVFREARRGQILRSDDWNGVQRELRASIRNHEHRRSPLEGPDDSAAEDIARQITTDEIADGAVTAAKLGPDVVLGGIVSDKTRSFTTQLIAQEPTQGPTQGPTMGVVSLGARSRERVEHGLGPVPVGVVIGIQQRVTGLRGDFDVYGLSGSVVAAVPRKPDGTFTLVSTDEDELSVRWWAVSGGEISTAAAPRARRKDR